MFRVTQRGRFVEPDRLRWAIPDRREGETAFVITRAPEEETWRSSFRVASALALLAALATVAVLARPVRGERGAPLV